jgi:hypothetical protein
MTFQISQRGKECLKTAQTLLRAAQNMTDRVIAGQLKALADDYQRRAEKASHVDAAKHSLDRLLTLKASGVHDLMSSFTALREKMPSGVAMLGARPGHELFIPLLPPESFKVRADILHQDGMVVVMSSRNRSLTADCFSN